MATKSNFRDQVLMLFAAVLVCVLVGATFWFGEDYHVNPLWLFLAWSSILLTVVVGRGFRSQWKKPAFILFFVVWMFIHLLMFALLLIYSSWFYMILVVPIELWIGYIAAYSLFDVLPDQGNAEKGPDKGA